MLLMWPWGPAFWTVRAAKRGSRRLNPRFAAFVSGIEAEYGFAPLWVELSPDNDWLRDGSCLLTIVADRTDQCEAVTQDGYLVPKLSVTRFVRQLFQRTCRGMTVHGRFGLPRRAVDATRLRVLFSFFEPIAVQKAHESISGRRLRAFEERLGLGEMFWCTASGLREPVVFVHTDEQAAAIRASGLPIAWSDLWYQLVQPFDEFGYVTRDSIEIRVDSKQNFDDNFESNWRLYGD